MKKLVCLCLLLLASCSPEVQPTQIAQPSESRIGKEHFNAAQGVELPLRRWLPAKKPKAVILALHGFNDYSNAFERPGVFFKDRGIAVYAYDQRGFGASPHTGIWAGEENLVADVRQCLKQLAATHPRTPIYLMGESMGGAVAIKALAEKDAAMPEVKGLVLVAPALWSRESMSSLYQGVLWAMVHIMPHKEFTGRDLKILASDNIPMLRMMGKDPLIIKSTRVDAIYGVVNVMDSAYVALPQLSTPTLLLYGAQDQVIPAAAMNKALPRFSIPMQVGYYKDGYHMLLRDLQGDIVLRDIVSWIKKPKAPLPSGSGLPYDPAKPPVRPFKAASKKPA